MPDSYQKISVIIPAYNIEDLIEKCVDSVANQDYPKELLEIIVVDDGSTDSTGQICDRLADKYDNVTALHKPNGGSSSARNLGIKHATGDYLGFVDSDDFIDPRMYREMMECALKYGADMVQISRDEISHEGTRLPDVVIPPDSVKEVLPKDHLKSLLMHTGDASFCTKITRKSFFTDEMLFPEGALNEDFYLMIHMLSKINKLVILPEQYYHVFYRLGSNSRKDNKDKDYFPSVFTDIVVNADVALDLVKENAPELTEIAERFGFVQRLDYLLHIPISKMTSDNEFYQKVVENIRSNKKKIKTNLYLSKKQRTYLRILMINPRLVRKAHAFVRGL